VWFFSSSFVLFTQCCKFFLDCPILIVLSVFSIVYCIHIWAYHCTKSNQISSINKCQTYTLHLWIQSSLSSHIKYVILLIVYLSLSYLQILKFMGSYSLVCSVSVVRYNPPYLWTHYQCVVLRFLQEDTPKEYYNQTVVDLL
jgi:hypothetical protein